MAFRDTLHNLMPTFFPAIKSGNGTGGLPMPSGSGGRSYWWGNGSGPIFGGGGLNLNRTIDFAQAAGDVMQNSAVAACMNWIGTNWGDAPLKVGKLAGNKFEPEPHHPLEDLLDQPNEDFNGKWLMWALLSDYYRYGRAYAYIVLVNGAPHEIQYLPAQCTQAVSDKAGRLSHYAYRPAQQTIAVDKTLVVHFRFGVDPANTLEGLSPLAPVLPEIVSDNACARYPANVMHHGGLPPAVLTPERPAAGSNAAPLDPDTAKALSEAFNEKRAADPGKIPILSGSLRLIELGWKPSEMALNDLREEPETRIAAQFSIPCLVVGLRAGMIRSTYSNTDQAVKMAWTNCLVPLQKYFASEWTRQLLPYYPDSEGKSVAYDHTAVGVLQEDQNAKREQARKDYQGGILTHAETRAEQGRDPLPDSETGGLKTPGASVSETPLDGAAAIKSADWITINGHAVLIDGGDETGHVAETTPSASAKSMLAKQSAVYVGADIQRYSEEHNEPILAAGIKGVSLRDNEPVDVVVLRKGIVAHGVELKTMVSNSNNKITMKASAMERKGAWMQEHGAPYHTVVFDDHAVFNASGQGLHDESKRQIYYKRGFGSFRVGSMHPVKDMSELNALMDTPDAGLPAAAKPPKGYVSPSKN